MNSWPYEDPSTQYMVEGMRFSTNFLVSIKILQDTHVANLVVFCARENVARKVVKILGSLTIPFRKMNPFLGMSKGGT